MLIHRGHLEMIGDGWRDNPVGIFIPAICGDFLPSDRNMWEMKLILRLPCSQLCGKNLVFRFSSEPTADGFQNDENCA